MFAAFVLVDEAVKKSRDAAALTRMFLDGRFRLNAEDGHRARS
jgi:hypothetical protein